MNNLRRQICTADESDIPKIVEVLAPYAYKWREIGTALGFTQRELNKIQHNRTIVVQGPVGYLTAMLNEWVQWTEDGPHYIIKYATYYELCWALDRQTVDLGDDVQSKIWDIGLGEKKEEVETKEEEEEYVEMEEEEYVEMAPGDESTEESDAGFHIDSDDKSESDDEENVASHLSAVRQAMDEKGTLEHTIGHGAVVGPAGSGKSSLMTRLVGETPSSTSPSTGVADGAVQVEVKKSSSIAVNVFDRHSTWLKILYDEEAIRFTTLASKHALLNSSQLLTPTLLEKPAVSTENGDTPTDNIGSLGKLACFIKTRLKKLATRRRKKINKPIHIQSGAAAPSIKQHQTVKESNTTSQAQNGAGPGASVEEEAVSLPSGYVPPLDVFKNALHQGDLEKLRPHFENSWTLYLTDTGGQIEFQEVFPLLTSGPSIFFFTFRLDQDLSQRFTIEYRLPDGGRSKPYQSTLTVEEALLQTLASVASMGTFTYKDQQMESVSLKPKVFIVGTHKDMLDQATAQAKIKEIDERLQKIIKSTSHYREDLVEFASESQLIYTVNNFSEDDSDFKKIRAGVEQAVHRGQFKISFPAHWLIFSLVLRQETVKNRIISYNQCFAIARDCGISNQKELDHALRFLHTRVGLIRHFPQPDLRDMVIRVPQVLLNQVTHLIVNTFTFDNVQKRCADEFEKKGVFTFEDFASVNQSQDHSVPPEKLLKLLEHLRIVAPFQTEDGQMKYFLPCVLAHSEVRNSHTTTKHSKVPPLLVTFKSGYCPKGHSGALIQYLLSNEMRSEFTWKLKTAQIFRDQVTFIVSPYDVITLKIHPTFLELIHYRIPSSKPTKAYTVEKVCDNVRQCVEKGIKKVSSEMNLTSNAKHSLSFYCQHSDCEKSNGPHPATDASMDQDVPCTLWCNRSGDNVPSTPPTGCSVWFGKKCQELSDQELEDTKVPELREAFEVLLPMAAKWQDMAVLLSIPHSTVEIIRADNRQASVPCLRELLTTWLQQVDPRPSWNTLKEAVEFLGNPVKAQEIQDKYMK